MADFYIRELSYDEVNQMQCGYGDGGKMEKMSGSCLEHCHDEFRLHMEKLSPSSMVRSPS